MTTEAREILWRDADRSMERALAIVKDMPHLYQTQKDTLRVHGNGFIQIDLEPGLRFHVWDESIPRQAIQTPIHDHRFSFISRILMGELINISYEAIPIPPEPQASREGGWYLKPVAHRLHTPVPGDREDTKLVPVDESEYFMEVQSRGSYLEGQEYSFEARDFHETQHQGLTATLMRKTSEIPDHRVRVACPVDLEPDNIFNRYEVDIDAMWRIVERVSRSLSG